MRDGTTGAHLVELPHLRAVQVERIRPEGWVAPPSLIRNHVDLFQLLGECVRHLFLAFIGYLGHIPAELVGLMPRLRRRLLAKLCTKR